jgi:hypothetical protein
MVASISLVSVSSGPICLDENSDDCFSKKFIKNYCFLVHSKHKKKWFFFSTENDGAKLQLEMLLKVYENEEVLKKIRENKKEK